MDILTVLHWSILGKVAGNVGYMFFGVCVCVYVCECFTRFILRSKIGGGRVCLSSNIVQNICMFSKVVPTVIKSIENSVPTTSHQPFLLPVILF